MKKVYVLLAVLQALLLAACSGEETNTTGTGEGLSVQASLGETQDGTVATRSLITTFSSNTIGVFVEGTGYAPTTYSTCVVSASGTAQTPDPAIYLSASASVYGFYPITDVSGTGNVALSSPTSASIIPVKILAADNFSANAQTDYLYATSDGTVSKSDRTVVLTFHHALAKLTFKVKTENYGGTGTLDTIKLKTADGATCGYFQTGTTTIGSGMAVSGGAISGLNSSTTTNLTYTGSVNLTTTSTQVATLLVAPQTIPTDTKVYLTIDGQIYSVTLPRVQATAWAKGTNYTYPLKVSGGSLSVDGTVTITDWTGTTAEDETTVE
jgi:hypothetical protein